jgi:hypothetical protein
MITRLSRLLNQQNLEAVHEIFSKSTGVFSAQAEVTKSSYKNWIF